MDKKLTSSLKGVNDILHRIRLKLYPNRLPEGGRYHARTSNEKALTREEVCQSLKNRGGFTGNYKDLLEYTEQYYDEMAYLLCDGYAVNSGYYTIFPNVGGTFDSANDPMDPKKHPFGFRLRVGRRLKELFKFISFEVLGLAATNGYIRQFYDVFSDTHNDSVTGSDNFIIAGDKIKVVGEEAEGCGIFFEMTDGSGTRIPVKKRLIKNLPSEIVGTAPMMIAPKSYRVVIVTRYTSGGVLKEPRTITSDFEIDAT